MIQEQKEHLDQSGGKTTQGVQSDMQNNGIE